MKDSSVNHYLVNLLDVIYRSLDKPGHYANICTIDLKMVFNLIDHTTAVQKLIQIDIDLVIIPTLCSFISDHTQTLRYNGATSSSQILMFGVSQGTKLGPMMFLIMVNDAVLRIKTRKMN